MNIESMNRLNSIDQEVWKEIYEKVNRNHYTLDEQKFMIGIWRDDLTYLKKHSKYINTFTKNENQFEFFFGLACSSSKNPQTISFMYSICKSYINKDTAAVLWFRCLENKSIAVVKYLFEDSETEPIRERYLVSQYYSACIFQDVCHYNPQFVKVMKYLIEDTNIISSLDRIWTYKLIQIIAQIKNYQKLNQLLTYIYSRYVDNPYPFWGIFHFQLNAQRVCDNINSDEKKKIIESLNPLPYLIKSINPLMLANIGSSLKWHDYIKYVDRLEALIPLYLFSSLDCILLLKN